MIRSFLEFTLLLAFIGIALVFGLSGPDSWTGWDMVALPQVSP
jgi:hypothetical protein